MIRDLNILNGDYSRVFKSTCEYFISKLSKRYNIDLSKYNIKIGTIRLGQLPHCLKAGDLY